MSVPGTLPALSQFWGWFKPTQAANPIAKARVRQALSLAIDRQQIIDLYEGQGYISYKEASEARLNAQQEFTDRLGELYAQEESILKRGLATVAKTAQDKLKLQDKLSEITLRREKLEREAQQSNLEREIKLPGVRR